jgi:hypothetical protein
MAMAVAAEPMRQRRRTILAAGGAVSQRRRSINSIRGRAERLPRRALEGNFVIVFGSLEWVGHDGFAPPRFAPRAGRFV